MGIILKEEWKDIPGYAGKYMASSKGRIVNRKTRRFLCSGGDKNGYLRASLRNEAGITKTWKIHRLIMISFKLRDDWREMQVNHINGIKKDNSVDNLEWCTCIENIRHAEENGLRGDPLEGTKNHSAKLSIKDLKNIKEFVLKGENNKHISEMVNISCGSLNDLLRGDSYVKEFSAYRQEIDKYKEDQRARRREEARCKEDIKLGKSLAEKDINEIKKQYFVEGLNFGEICERYNIYKSVFNNIIATVPDGDPLRLKRKFCSSSHQSGEKNGRAKLNREKVLEIMELLKTDISTAKIGSIYGVSGAVVRSIRAGKTWASVTGIDYSKRTNRRYKS